MYNDNSTTYLYNYILFLTSQKQTKKQINKSIFVYNVLQGENSNIKDRLVNVHSNTMNYIVSWYILWFPPY